MDRLKNNEQYSKQTIKTVSNMKNIIDAVMGACGCTKEDAQEYVDFEVRNLRELSDAGDLRSVDFTYACENLGLEMDWVYYFINRVAGV